ncbi:SirB2 family protein [Flocculibacter collagenilyticus]|uniref:SirB2 family protein n=1 Tax=Flocculibacter collagenilyticus TaxID=2744479 RepID=UPI0018F42592|nr:SirB2 family protein [Flocculibacter collagenilyticus]
MYMAVKHLHLTFVLLSVSLLVLRFAWMLKSSPMLEKRWVKIVPHINDTLLLISAFGLCFMISQYPFQDKWLTEKIFAVVAYILMGTMALKGRTTQLRWIAMLGAFGWLGLIAKLAVTKQPIFLS